MKNPVFAERMIARRLYMSLAAVLLFAVLPMGSNAQFTIKPDDGAGRTVVPEVKDPILVSPQLLGPLDYRTEAMRKMEKAKRRLERNTLNITSKLSVSQATFTNWAQGGDDMFNGNVSLYLKYQYKSSKFSLTNTFDGALGLDIIDTIKFKSTDKFDFLSRGQWAINKHWSYSGDIRLISQFMKGYKNRKDKTYLSNFLSPGTLSVALGFTYKPFLKEDLEITISPLAGQAIIVVSDSLSNQGKGGIKKGKHFEPTIGPQLVIKYEKKLWKDLLYYRMNFTSFYNFEYSPNVMWNNFLTLKPLKFLTLDYNWSVIYDEGKKTKDMTQYMQFSSKFLISLAFTFNNK